MGILIEQLHKQGCGVKHMWTMCRDAAFSAAPSCAGSGDKRRSPGLILTAGLLVLSGSAAARQGDGAQPAAAIASGDQTGERELPRIKTHAPAGFRLYRPGYRLVGTGALVSVQLCRLPGWAAASPQRLRVERLDASGQPGESHERYLPRLGERTGNNCSFAALRVDSVPMYGETIKICAISGGGACP